MSLNPALLFEVDSWGGRIGNIFWANSDTAPHPSPFSRRQVVYWGCCVIDPEPGIMYGEECDVD